MIETAEKCGNFVLGGGGGGGGGCKLVDSKSLNGSMVFTASFSCSPYHYAHVQDLTSQVSAETDPVSLLPKVVSLLYIQVSLFRLLCFC
jgi:hypothetical protein